MADDNMAKQMMTLAAISYVRECCGLDEIKATIEKELAKSAYATKGDWKLEWGPAKSDDPMSPHDNLIYLASRENRSGIPDIALVIRGTAFDSILSWMEDIPTGLVEPWFSGTPNGSKLSKEFNDAAQGMTQFKDPVTGKTLQDHITKLKINGNRFWYVTGHSQGGGLTPIMHAWLKSEDVNSIDSYSFAAPTPGDSAFAAYIDDLGTSYRYANTLDVVPLGYRFMRDVGTKGHPVEDEWKHILVNLIVDAWEHQYDLSVDDFAQPCSENVLGPVADTRPGVTFTQRVAAQHNYNSYLKLLNATEMDFGVPSPLK